MKISIDLTSLADNFSGLERYALSIAKEMIKAASGKEHQYILLFKNKIYPEFLEFIKYEYVEARILRGKNKLIFNQLILPVLLYRIKADRYLFLAFPVPLLFFRKGIFALVADLVCWDCPETMKWKAKIFFRTMLRHTFCVSEGIITISNFTRERIASRFGKIKQPVLVAYCGISDVFLNASEEKTTIRKKYRLPEKYLLCLSTLEPRKNLSLLITAYAELRQEGKLELPLVLAGRKGWKIDKFLEGMDEACKDQIVITGFIDEGDLPFVYREASVFIYPSSYEGFGMPPLEAAVMGTPVIASDAAAIPEVLGERGIIYFKSNNKEELKQALNSNDLTADKPVWENDYKQKYQWKNSAEKILRFIK